MSVNINLCAFRVSWFFEPTSAELLCQLQNILRKFDEISEITGIIVLLNDKQRKHLIFHYFKYLKKLKFCNFLLDYQFGVDKVCKKKIQCCSDFSFFFISCQQNCTVNIKTFQESSVKFSKYRNQVFFKCSNLTETFKKFCFP